MLGVVLAPVLDEAAARLLTPVYAPRKATDSIAPLGTEPPSWVYAPGSKVVFEWDGDPLHVLPAGARMETQVNEAGLRGPRPLPDEPCVVVLGDSFTFGEGVADDATFVGRLREQWAPRGLKFVNAGVAGHGTIEEAARLEALLDHFRPRAVVLVFVPNDAIPWQSSSERGTDLRNVQAAGGSRLLALAGALTSSHDVEDWYLSYYQGAESAHWERARDALTWMAHTCAARGGRFGVVAFPLMHRLDDDPLTAITDLVRTAAQASGAGFLDLTPSFAGRDAQTFWAHPSDRHPNAAAHEIAADALTPFVTELLR